jgi:SAM-dependent methyltransferase
VTQKIDLYDSAYANYASQVYRQIRVDTYGEDLGQTSWVTTEESHEIPKMLNLANDSFALEIGCGSGGYALYLAQRVGCRIVGLDINAPGVDNANQLAVARSLASKVRFEQCDASKKLPFDDNTFDAVFSNDVLCHLPGRPAVLGEVFRVLKPGGKMLFSDALIIGGLVSHQEIERIMGQVGFHEIRATDTTENAADIAKRWHDARETRKTELVAAESEANFEGLQRFLSCVQTLCREGRLRRHLYSATKPR